MATSVERRKLAEARIEFWSEEELSRYVVECLMASYHDPQYFEEQWLDEFEAPFAPGEE